MRENTAAIVAEAYAMKECFNQAKSAKDYAWINMRENENLEAISREKTTPT